MLYTEYLLSVIELSVELLCSFYVGFEKYASSINGLCPVSNFLNAVEGLDIVGRELWYYLDL